MKIAFHLNSMGIGGAERVVSILSDSFIKKGHEVTIATEWTAEKEYPLNPAVRRVNVGPEGNVSEAGAGKREADRRNPGRLQRILARYANLRKFVKGERPDVLLSFCNKANFRAAVALTGLKTKLIVSVRNDPKLDYAPYPVSTALMKMRADGFVFQTKEARDFFGAKAAASSAIILNPLSERIARAQDIAFSAGEWTGGRTQNGDGSIKEKTIVTFGRISEQKNHILLVKAVEQALPDVPELKLKIFGEVQSEEIYRMLKEYIREHELGDFVELPGPTDDVPGELEKAYLFALSSNYEGMPNALIEAMAMGLPCISTDCPCGGPRALIENGVDGLLIPVSDVDAMAEAMRKLCGDPTLAGTLAKNAAKLKDRLLPEKIAEEWLAFIGARL